MVECVIAPVHVLFAAPRVGEQLTKHDDGAPELKSAVIRMEIRRRELGISKSQAADLQYGVSASASGISGLGLGGWEITIALFLRSSREGIADKGGDL